MNRVATVTLALILSGCPLPKRKREAPDAAAVPVTSATISPTEACSWAASVGMPRKSAWNDVAGEFGCFSVARSVGANQITYWVYGSADEARRLVLVVDIYDPKTADATLGEATEAFAAIVRERLDAELEESTRMLLARPADKTTVVAGRLLSVQKTMHENGKGFEARYDLALENRR